MVIKEAGNIEWKIMTTQKDNHLKKNIVLCNVTGLLWMLFHYRIINIVIRVPYSFTI